MSVCYLSNQETKTTNSLGKVKSINKITIWLKLDHSIIDYKVFTVRPFIYFILFYVLALTDLIQLKQ